MSKPDKKLCERIYPCIQLSDHFILSQNKRSYRLDILRTRISQNQKAIYSPRRNGVRHESQETDLKID